MLVQHRAFPKTVENRLLWQFIYFISITSTFFVVHLTTDTINRFVRKLLRTPVSRQAAYIVDIFQSNAATIKMVVFICAVCVICWPVIKDIFQEGKIRVGLTPIIKSLLVAVTIFIAVALLAFRPGTASMGTNYAIIAQDPFIQNTSSHSTRLLAPALAHFFFLRDFQPYYLFSISITLIFLMLLHQWTRDHTPLKTWELISLSTCSFVIFQFQYGGYPDILVYLMFILIMQENTSQESRLSLLLLALLTHESSVCVGIILAIRYLNRKSTMAYIVFIIIYGTIWLWVSGWDIHNVVGEHSIDEKSGIEWLLSSPVQELIGVIVSYKAIWVIIIASIAVSIDQRNWGDAFFITACVGAGIFMTTLGVDTSRLMGFAFPGILIAITFLYQKMKKPNSRYILSAIFAVNLIIPSFYIGLNGWIEFVPGIYKFLFGWLAFI